jgi:DNA-3-methyladenine glycosylase
MARRRLGRRFYQRDPREVAPELWQGARARIAHRAHVEVEAYCGREDPGSHAYRGMTSATPPCSETAGPAVRLPHVRDCNGAPTPCAAAGAKGSRGPPGERPSRCRGWTRCALDGWRPAGSRPAVRPARLCQGFGLDGTFDGSDLVTADRGVTIVDDGVPPPDVPAVSTRIGLSLGTELPWRWCTPGSLHLSRPA